MAKKNELAIIGRSPLAEELAELGREKGFAARLYTGAARVARGAAVVVDTEAANEAAKKASLARLDAGLPRLSLVLTSSLGFNTSRIASWTKRPERVVGFATFFPLRQKQVIELSAGLRTAAGALSQAEAFFQALGKETVRVKDTPGLVFPRILSLIINEAARALDEGIAGAEEIDVAMRLGTNYPLGPLRWADQAGLDEVLAVLEGLHRETGDDRYRPAPLLRKMVLAGYLGEKRGKGFYNHRSEA
jgi:3-hydroxybutyryl-CoA dehydrogenase